jgi:hypothetical protein
MSTAVPAPPATDGPAFDTALSRFRQVRDRHLVPAAQRDDLRSYLSAQNTCRQPLIIDMSVALDNLARAGNAAAGQQITAVKRAGETAFAIALTLVAGALLLAIVLTLAVSAAADELARIAHDLPDRLSIFRY